MTVSLWTLILLFFIIFVLPPLIAFGILLAVRTVESKRKRDILARPTGPLAVTPHPNWFQQHLNWTAALGGFALTGIATMFLVVLVVYPLFEGPWLVWLALSAFLALGSVSPLVLGGCVLILKDRKLPWLLLAFVPLGYFVLLPLENRGNEPGRLLASRIVTVLGWTSVAGAMLTIVLVALYIFAF